MRQRLRLNLAQGFRTNQAWTSGRNWGTSCRHPLGLHRENDYSVKIMSNQPQASPLFPADLDEHPHRRPALVPVWPPGATEPVLMSPDNAAEATRRRCPPWSLTAPRPDAGRPNDVPDADMENANPYPTVLPDDRPLPPITATTLGKLTRVRAEATALGIEVDPRWGLRRLGEEIAACQIGKD